MDDASGQAYELDSFDLFTKASIASTDNAPRRTETDISGVISQMAGLDRAGSLPSTVASIEVDDVVAVDLKSHYAPYRDGEVFGEERSMLSDSINRATAGLADLQIDLRTIGPDGNARRGRFTKAAPNVGPGLPEVRIDEQGNGHRLVIGPLGGDPLTLQVDATSTDRFGLRSTTRASIQNFRVYDARAWIERASNISLAQLTERRDTLERSARLAPSDASIAGSSMLRTLTDVLEGLDRRDPAPAAQVAGAVRLAHRVEELLSAENTTGRRKGRGRKK
jgi:hypothetical protein